MSWPDYLTTYGFCGDEDTHGEHWFRGFNGIDHNTVDIKCRGRKGSSDGQVQE